jgi:hypothetical protein
MCDLTQEFILCSCGEENLADEKVGWILKRTNEDLLYETRKGMPAVNFLTEDQKEVQVSIVQRLNSSNCFDFDYEPQNDDFLRIKTSQNKRIWYAFRFYYGEWMEDNSTSYDGWKSQLENHKIGKIGSASFFRRFLSFFKKG